VVKLTDGRVIRRHNDHICLRYHKEKATVADRTTAGSIQVETPQETVSEEQGHSVVPAEDDGLSFTNTQPAPLGDAFVAQQEYCAEYSHKLPERLTL
jgi:hypothetical protein